MKWSRFNVLFKSKEDFYFLYNSRINSFFKVDKPLYDLLSSFKDGTIDISEVGQDVVNNMIQKKIIVNQNDDNSYISQMEYLKRKRSFCCNDLSLVIAPTLNCNFKCPYCYEHDLPTKKMNHTTQDKLIDFINLHKNKTKKLSLYWHGGEPMLAFEEIKNILTKIIEKTDIPLTSHQMVTNGYIFSKEICDFFKSTKLDYIQITVDGTKETHDKNRIHKSGISTYNKIIENIDLILEEMPDCNVGVRVNIHNANKGDYPIIHEKLTERWNGKNCTVYPAFVLSHGGCNVSCLSSSEKSRFYIDLYHKYKMKNINFIPNLEVGSCSAIYENHYVIDPEGLLYKCWADFDIPERIIGNLETGINNWEYISEYTLGTDKFKDEKCLKCNIFPICEGGCNRFRLENKLYDTPYDVCPIDSPGLINYLQIIYEQMANKKDAIA